MILWSWNLSWIPGQTLQGRVSIGWYRVLRNRLARDPDPRSVFLLYLRTNAFPGPFAGNPQSRVETTTGLSCISMWSGQTARKIFPSMIREEFLHGSRTSLNVISYIIIERTNLSILVRAAYSELRGPCTILKYSTWESMNPFCVRSVGYPFQREPLPS